VGLSSYDRLPPGETFEERFAAGKVKLLGFTYAELLYLCELRLKGALNLKESA
jgi:hypothetical protein